MSVLTRNASVRLAIAGLVAAGRLFPQPQLAGCQMFPADNIWNTPVDQLPVAPQSTAYIESIGAGKSLHPDFSRMGAMPFNIVPPNQAKVGVQLSSPESDLGSYPVPDNPLVEPPTDRHLLILQKGECRLYEIFNALKTPDGAWRGTLGAVFDLRSNSLRPGGWSSADAAGLPILPGLVRYDEVASGAIRHALRMTAPRTRRHYVWPARHFASRETNPSLPPMGQRFRLRSDYDVSSFDPQARVILEALKKYGMMLADNGGPWFLTGAPDRNWNEATLEQLKRVRGNNFEAVDVSGLMLRQDSGQVRPRKGSN